MTWERFAADRAKQDAEMERLRAALEKEQREHANCEDVNAQRFQTLTDTIITLTQQVTAMRPIVEAVAKWGFDEAIPVEFYEQARAFVAAHSLKVEQ